MSDPIGGRPITQPFPACVECGRRLINTESFASCPVGHGQLKPKLNMRHERMLDLKYRRQTFALERGIAGACRCCGRVIRLTTRGRVLRRHGWTAAHQDDKCSGSGGRPARESGR